jgi:signal transduction histidine kinase
MQFARPAAPRRVTFDLGALLGEVVAAQREHAESRRVRLDLAVPGPAAPVHADPEQLRLAIGCLVRNAIEAAPAEGWARLRLGELDSAALAAVVIEDSGPGPDPTQCPFLFDPFYSGRSAGRGRGLGLPIAWRLIQLQGGTLRLEPARPGHPTRAVVHLPRAVPLDAGYRSCA